MRQAGLPLHRFGDVARRPACYPWRVSVYPDGSSFDSLPVTRSVTTFPDPIDIARPGSPRSLESVMHAAPAACRFVRVARMQRQCHAGRDEP